MDSASRNPRPSDQQGFTLVEAVISMVILSVMVVMALHTLGSSARSRQIQATLSKGPALAGQLMTEVLQSAYEEPNEPVNFGPEASETGPDRGGYDDVDDYHGWSASPPQDKAGAAMSNLTGWQRSVTVQYADPNNPTATAPDDRGLKRITVTVTAPRGEQSTLTALRSNVSGYDREPAEQTTYVSWVGVELQIGGDAEARVRSGVNLLNQLPGQGQ